MVTTVWSRAPRQTYPCNVAGFHEAWSLPNVRFAAEEPSSGARRLPSKAERTKQKCCQFILVCIFSLFSFYLIFNFLLLLFKYYVTCAYISNWGLEVTSFDPGPAVPWMDTSWLDPPPFGQMAGGPPQASDEYSNLSFTLSIKNNPSWLKVCIRYISLRYALGHVISVSNPHIVFSGDASITVHRRFYLHCINRIACQCFRHILSTHRAVPFVLAMEVEPTLFGQHVDLLETLSFVSFGNLTQPAGLPLEVAHVCEKLYMDGQRLPDDDAFNDRDFHTKVANVWEPAWYWIPSFIPPTPSMVVIK